MKFASPVLFVSNVSEVLSFYRTALGAELSFYDENLGFAEISFNGSKVGISSHKAGKYMMPDSYDAPEDANPSSIELAFFCDDVQESYDKALSHGAQSLAAPKKMDWGQTVAYVKSIEGTVIGLCSEI